MNIWVRIALNPTSANSVFLLWHSLGSWYEDPQNLPVCLMDWQGYKCTQQNKDPTYLWTCTLALFLHTLLPVCLHGQMLKTNQNGSTLWTHQTHKDKSLKFLFIKTWWNSGPNMWSEFQCFQCIIRLSPFQLYLSLSKWHNLFLTVKLTHYKLQFSKMSGIFKTAWSWNCVKYWRVCLF